MAMDERGRHEPYEYRQHENGKQKFDRFHQTRNTVGERPKAIAITATTMPYTPRSRTMLSVLGPRTGECRGPDE